MNRATACANANIALVKYWGKNNQTLNIPSAPSLSMTLDGIGTRVTVARSPNNNHELYMESKPCFDGAFIRLRDYLEKLRELYSFEGFFSVRTRATVPYQAGLASSASFYAALALALKHYLQLDLTDTELSAIARLGSASAARSIFGGFVGLYGGDLSHKEAHAFALSTSLKLAMIVAIVDNKPKPMSSREAMIKTARTSPFFDALVKSTETDFLQAKDALLTASFDELGTIMEHSTLKMHACMWAARPSINYLLPSSLELMNLVQHLRNFIGLKAFFTMDAGPNVKILCEAKDALLIEEKLRESSITKDIRVSYEGPGARIDNEHLS